MAKRLVIRIWTFPDLVETGIWCEDCLTSGAVRIPVLTSTGASEVRGCLTCRRRKQDGHTA